MGMFHVATIIATILISYVYCVHLGHSYVTNNSTQVNIPV